MGELIPLFPLATPLFPGVVLPLQVFEPRYRRLVDDLLALPEGAGRRFGVVAIRQGWEVERVAPAAALHDVGCTARLEGVRPRPDGGFRIVTLGADRFRLLDVVAGDEPPYLQGEVAWLAGEEAAENAGPSDALAVLVPGVRALFAAYVAEVSGRQAGDSARGEAHRGAGETAGEDAAALLDEVADDPRALSFLVAATALLTTEDRQALLTVSSTRRRLAAEARLLRRELALVRAVGAVPAPLQEFAVPESLS